MTFANLDRVKVLLELTVPALKDRTDYDDRIRRLMGVVHEKIRLKVVQINGGTLDPFLILEAFKPPVAAYTLTAALTNTPRRIRFRLKEADEVELAATGMVATVTGNIDGIQTTEDVTFARNGEFVTKAAFESIVSPIAFASIPSTPGTIQVLEDVDPVLADIEDMMTACLYLREAVDRFEKDAEPEEMEIWCKKANALLKEWIKVNVAADVLDAPLALQAAS